MSQEMAASLFPTTSDKVDSVVLEEVMKELKSLPSPDVPENSRLHFGTERTEVFAPLPPATATFEALKDGDGSHKQLQIDSSVSGSWASTEKNTTIQVVEKSDDIDVIELSGSDDDLERNPSKPLAFNAERTSIADKMQSNSSPFQTSTRNVNSDDTRLEIASENLNGCSVTHAPPSETAGAMQAEAVNFRGPVDTSTTLKRPEPPHKQAVNGPQQQPPELQQHPGGKTTREELSPGNVVHPPKKRLRIILRYPSAADENCNPAPSTEPVTGTSTQSEHAGGLHSTGDVSGECREAHAPRSPLEPMRMVIEHGLSCVDDLEDEESDWVHCNRCGKWRAAPLTELQRIRSRGRWTCKMQAAWGCFGATCSDPEERNPHRLAQMQARVKALKAAKPKKPPPPAAAAATAQTASPARTHRQTASPARHRRRHRGIGEQHCRRREFWRRDGALLNALPPRAHLLEGLWSPTHAPWRSGVRPSLVALDCGAAIRRESRALYEGCQKWRDVRNIPSEHMEALTQAQTWSCEMQAAWGVVDASCKVPESKQDWVLEDGKAWVQQSNSDQSHMPAGWRQELVLRKDGIQTDTYYYAPCKKKLRSRPDIERHIQQHPECCALPNFDIKQFTFNARVSEAQLGTADLLSIRLAANTDPCDAIAAFNAFLASARRRKSTLDNDEVKSLFIKALDMEFYAPVATSLP
ncbi:hypothetical protein CYMTET_11456 [Cymbomonas tetramitiformis]|uniref:CW-type domain-containing protein n=1 Tax=Cymbomonas tetramitiformis TaxID=36881 RepID=A0AAE0GM29_9CHLO|nr:hypothetical protein CYMTET_11456 [Cymbomonas tetramitiformis]